MAKGACIFWEAGAAAWAATPASLQQHGAGQTAEARAPCRVLGGRFSCVHGMVGRWGGRRREPAARGARAQAGRQTGRLPGGCRPPLSSRGPLQPAAGKWAAAARWSLSGDLGSAAHCPKAAMRLRFFAAAGWCTCSGAPPPPSSWSAASMARGRRMRPSSCAACSREQGGGDR